MAANTSNKVATLTGAAKDDAFLSAATGLNEDNGVRLAVLTNDPGAARLYSLWQGPLGAAASQFPVTSSATLASGATIAMNADGTIGYQPGAGFQHLGEAVVATDSFSYTVRMANGALSTALVSVEIMGKNDAATITGAYTGTVTEDGNATATGSLVVQDADDGENVFASVASNALHGVYGDFSFDSGSGAWTYSLNNSAASVQGLTAGQVVYDVLQVGSADGSAGASIRVAIHGANEPVESNPATQYIVNNGLQHINGRSVISGFDSNDSLRYTGQYSFLGVIARVDSDNDGSLDSSLAKFNWHDTSHGGTDVPIDVLLVGYLALTPDQIVYA